MLGMLAGSKVAGGVGWSDPALRRGIAKWFDMIESYITHDIHNAFKRHRAIKSALVKFGPCSARCSASREADGCPTTKLFANDNDKPFAPLLRATFLFTICLSRFLFKRATPITGTWNRTEAGMHDSACTRSYVVVVVVVDRRRRRRRRCCRRRMSRRHGRFCFGDDCSLTGNSANYGAF